ncbi:MAG: AbrB/MazE/SpoVT family DNA-binding domain-containing protein [Thermoplasmatales archaeon]
MNQNLELPFRRKVTAQRATLYVALPKTWTRALRIQKGDYMDLRVGADGVLKILPEKEKEMK